jgi:hypothetical protein
MIGATAIVVSLRQARGMAVSGYVPGLDAMDMTVVTPVHVSVIKSMQVRIAGIIAVLVIAKAAHKKGDYDKTPAKHSGGQVNL